METDKTRFIQVDEIKPKKIWLAIFALVIGCVIIIVLGIAVRNLNIERNKLLETLEHNSHTQADFYQQIDSLNQRIQSLTYENDRLLDEIASLSRGSSVYSNQGSTTSRNSSNNSHYRVIVAEAKVYDYVGRDVESAQMEYIGLVYKQGNVVVGDIVEIPPHGRFLKVSFEKNGQNKRGFVSLSDITPVQQ